MSMWRILLHGLPSQGPFKAIYDRQRRSTDEYRAHAAKLKRRRYRKNPTKQLSVNRSYKERFVERYGLEAWNARQREYKRRWRARRQGEIDI